MVCFQSQPRTICNDPDTSWKDAMQFRLTYEGTLLASRTIDAPARAKHKQSIRKVFHKQLKNLWQQTPFLGRVVEDGHWTPFPDSPLSMPVEKGFTMAEHLASRFSCGPYRLVPLVIEDRSLICSLDILLLRPGKAGAILSSGDIDNRVKTLIDALRIPGPDAKELGGHTPDDGDNPFYCLLQDDKLISHLSVETDTLLEPIGPSLDDNDARVVITVRVKPAEVMFANLSFAGD